MDKWSICNIIFLLNSSTLFRLRLLGLLISVILTCIIQSTTDCYWAYDIISMVTAVRWFKMSTNTTPVGTDTDGANHQSNLGDRHVEILDNHR